MGDIKTYETTVLIDKQEVPCKGWNITGGAFGSVGTVRLTTTCEMLDAAGVDLVGLVDASKIIPIDVFIDIDGKKTQIFGGFYDDNDGEWPQEEITLNGRDWAGLLMDKKSCIAGETKTVERIVTELCQFSGITPQITGNADVKPGTDLNGANILTMGPQEHWSVIQKLAQFLGYEVTVLPQKILVFGPPDLNPPQRTFHYKADPGSKPDLIKLLKLHTKNNNRRNKTFRVVVTSWDQQRVARSTGQAVVLGDDVSNTGLGKSTYNPSTGQIQTSISTGGSIPAGIYGGSSGPIVSNTIDDKLKDKPIFRFNRSGLSPAQAQKEADSIAQDLAKREFVITGVISGMPEIKAHDRLTIEDHEKGLLKPFASRGYSIVGFEHSFSMNERNTEYTTKFSAVAIPPGISDDVSATFANWSTT